MHDLTVKKLCQAFAISPPGLFQLEARGYLPSRSHGKLTPEYIEALAARLRTTRGSIPPAAEDLLREVGHEGER